jgi:hypothetical protein
LPEHVQPSKKGDAMNIELEERVRRLAYQIWELEGRPDGCAPEHWERALRELDGAVSIPAAPAKAKAASKASSRPAAKTPAQPKRKTTRPQVTFN